MVWQSVLTSIASVSTVPEISFPVAFPLPFALLSLFPLVVFEQPRILDLSCQVLIEYFSALDDLYARLVKAGIERVTYRSAVLEYLDLLDY